MSEELLQTIPQKIGRYDYYKLGATTLNQLKNHGLIPKKDYGALRLKKPDGLVLYQKKPKAVVEFKTPENFRTEKQVQKAYKQELETAKALCKILIVTDGTSTLWINALNGERIVDGQNNPVVATFNPKIVKNTNSIERLIGELDESLTKTNSKVRSVRLIDPMPLALRLWQTIWAATGKTPVKCLYNVAELFIFKFLSDLKVLADDVGFQHVYEKSRADAEEALEYYAANTRKHIYKLFPAGKDRTTIINGTIFVNEKGEPNLSQSTLFAISLEHLKKYGEEFGGLTRIDKQFKTRLFESFLNQEVEALGQYFTPRRIVQTMIRMAGIDEPTFQFRNKTFCDPFCGVGGFVLEILNMNEAMRACYKPDVHGKVEIPFTLRGFDKGFEQDEERVIILAKANMLIYLAEILFAHPQATREFAKQYNSTFTLFRDNLATFGHIIPEGDKPDYILSNPPFVTRGSKIIKEEIKKNQRIRDFFRINGFGLESLALEWIVRSLRPGGKAFVIIPDGILWRVQGERLRDFILQECYLDAIVSLPVKTFYVNNEHTYIFCITKKSTSSDYQAHPVFTYLVSNIGERLNSVRREEIDENDLPEMEKLFRVFTAAPIASKELIERESSRCKIWPIDHFRQADSWIIDQWWTHSERVALGIEEEELYVTRHELEAEIDALLKSIRKHDEALTSNLAEDGAYREITLGDKSLFELFIGDRVLKKDFKTLSGDIPLFSSNVFEPASHVKTGNVKDFSHPSIMWGIDGNFEFRLMEANRPFATTDHTGTIRILDPNIVPEYLILALYRKRIEKKYSRSIRASMAMMRKYVVKIPVTRTGEFDMTRQRKLARVYGAQISGREELRDLKKKLDETFSHYLSSLLG